MLSAVSARRRAERWGCLSARSRYCAFTQCRPRSLQETSCKENRRGRAGSGGPTRTLLHRHRQVNDARLGLSALVVKFLIRTEPGRSKADVLLRVDVGKTLHWQTLAAAGIDNAASAWCWRLTVFQFRLQHRQTNRLTDGVHVRGWCFLKTNQGSALEALNCGGVRYNFTWSIFHVS